MRGKIAGLALALLALLYTVPALGQDVRVNCQPGGVGTGFDAWRPASPTYPCPTNVQSVGGAQITGGTLPTASLATSSIVGAVSQYRVQSANTTNSTLITTPSVTVAGNLYAPKLCNSNLTSVRYFKLYDASTAPTVGTTIPIATLPMGPNGGCLPPFEGPISFITGLAFALTTGAADTDTGAVALNEITGVILYKSQ